MADNNGRPYARSEDRTTRYRLYPIKGEPVEGAMAVVNADGDLEFTAAGGTGEFLVDDAAADLLFDDATSDLLYDG